MSNLADEEAATTIRAHHTELNEDLRARVAALRDAVRSGTDHAQARDAVIAYLDGELLPHAAAEEAALYPAGDSGITAMLVRAMHDEHRNLVGRVSDLRGTTDALDAATAAAAILALFESHLAKENDLLIPALVADPGVVLADLLHGMHELVGQASEESHTLGDRELDVRDEPPSRRHSLIFETFDALEPGADFELVNDHDPKPLYYQFAAEHSGTFSWDYVEQGPIVWRVRIGRSANGQSV